MGVAGYLALPGGPDSNVMNGFPASDPLMQVGVPCFVHILPSTWAAGM